MTLDAELLAFVISGTLPAEEPAQNRVKRAAKFLQWEGGKLWIKRRGDWV